ncbi:MAG: hypothetical protein IMW92_10380 [Bacillales bacterium]|nr:hypothetical protein [Bacillales bacterium]
MSDININIWGIIIPGLLLIFALFSDKLLKGFKKENKNKKDVSKKDTKETKETIQDILFSQAVFEKDGIIRVGDTYVSMIELEDFPGITASDHELISFWEDFRALQNAISTNFTFLLVSEYIELGNYVQDYLKIVDDNDILSPQLKESARYVAEHIKTYEQQDFRQYKNYIILKYNLLSAYASGDLSTGIHRLDTLVKELKKTSSFIPSDEGERLRMARTVLSDYESLIYQFADRHQLYIKKLNDEDAFRFIRRFVLRGVLRSDDFTDVASKKYPISETAKILQENGVELNAKPFGEKERSKTFSLAE